MAPGRPLRRLGAALGLLAAGLAFVAFLAALGVAGALTVGPLFVELLLTVRGR